MNENLAPKSRTADAALATSVAAGVAILASAASMATAGDLPGFVTVTRTGSTILVTGGDGEERIVIEPGDAPGELRIIGGGGTTVNDGSETVIGVGKRDTVIVSLGGSRDTCLVQGALPAFKSLVIDTGAGDDGVNFATASLPGAATLRDATGSNSFGISQSTFGKSLAIAGGDGNDTIFLNSVGVQGNLTVRPGGGQYDDLSINTTVVNGKTQLFNSADFFNCQVSNSTCSKPILIDGGAGDGFILFSDSTANSALKVKSGAGASQLRIFDSEVKGSVLFASSDGADTVDFVLARLRGRATIKLGDGSDQASLGDLTLGGKFKLLAESGDDTVSARDTLGSTASKPVILDGGTGTDFEGSRLAVTGRGRLIVKNFESGSD